jgi:hypothetical protein
MRSNIVIAGGLLLFGAIVITTSRPLRMQVEKNSITEHGIVIEMYETAFKDLVLKLKGQSTVFYIDCDLNDGINLEELKNKLLHKHVVIQYPEQWSEDNKKHFILKLEYDGEVIYAEE